MSLELSIKVKIGERVYPLTIKRIEEEGVRKAASLINKNIDELKNNYAVRDKQDLLAMTALQYASKYVNRNTETSAKTDESVAQTINDVDIILSDYLKKIESSLT